ncbi:MAG: tripartite tricarboxylate transporter substrate binding protein, partial [Burkholderiales bacterium]
MNGRQHEQAGLRLFAFLVAALISTASPAIAQKMAGDRAKDYPTKPVRWIIDFGSGGLSDTIARIVGAKLTE